MGLICCSLADVVTEASRVERKHLVLDYDWELVPHVVEYVSIVFVYMQHKSKI